jgi:PAS domain S-box-containing protein
MRKPAQLPGGDEPIGWQPDDRPAAAPDTTGERALDATSSINQRIFDTSLDLILVVDKRGNFLRVSPSSAAILGYQPDEMVGHSAAEFLYPDDLEGTRHEMRLARRGQVMRNFECRYIHKDGRIVTLAWTGVWSEPDHQHFFIGRDMSRRIALEQQLRQAQKMKAVGQLTGGIAHDFNNILTVITGMVEALSEAVKTDPILAEMVKSIEEAAERGAQLTQRMLAFARKQPLQPRPIDLNDIVTRMVAMLQRTLGEDIAVKTVLANGLWPAQADPFQLEDAIVNLAVNARDAMPTGGELAIGTSNIHLDEHYAAHNVEVAPGDYVVVAIADTGVGMPPEVIEHAFEPFFTTKDVGRGTGLGLSMVYGFVTQSRGHVRIASEIGRGTSIMLYLPKATTEGAAPDIPESAVEPVTDGRETILIVEDDAAVRKVAATILKRIGYQVWQAEDGKSALDILQTGIAIDLLFTDLIMPNGMSGQDLMRTARERRPDLKVLFASGYSEQFIAGRGVADHGIPLLSKPYRKQQLAQAIRKALDGPGPSA